MIDYAHVGVVDDFDGVEIDWVFGFIESALYEVGLRECIVEELDDLEGFRGECEAGLKEIARVMRAE